MVETSPVLSSVKQFAWVISDVSEIERGMRRKEKKTLFISGTHQQPSGQDVQLTASSFHSISTPAAPPCCAGSAGTGNATAHTYTHSDIQASHGPPPLSHPELPVYAKDN